MRRQSGRYQIINLKNKHYFFKMLRNELMKIKGANGTGA